MTIPTEMKKLVLHEHIGKYSKEELDQKLKYDTVPVPQPKSGEVLVRVAYSAVNPSDMAFIQGKYGKKAEVPCGAGFEGCGTVVASGGGFMGWRLTGKRVAFASDSVWAEYCIVKAGQCIELAADCPFNQATGAIVNPMTVMSFIEIARRGGHKSMVHTAAASTLGKQLIRMCKKHHNIEIVCVVRKDAQKEECIKQGADPDYVFNSEDEGFDASLKAACEKLQTKLAFDCVAGDITSRVAAALRPHGTVHVYGALSGKDPSISNASLIFQEKTLTGFWLQPMLKTVGLPTLISWTRTIARLLTTDMRSDSCGEFHAAQMSEAIMHGIANRNDGKVLISFEEKKEDGEAGKSS